MQVPLLRLALLRRGISLLFPVNSLFQAHLTAKFHLSFYNMDKNTCGRAKKKEKIP
ncbi:MAG: hypothetical protein ABIO86_19585 [Sphingomonas sp.]